MRWPCLSVPLFLVAAGCSSTSPSPPPRDSLTITAVAPATAAGVVIPAQYPYNTLGGVVVPPGSGLLSVSVAMSAVHSVPWAQLNVYLLTGGTSDQYCGQNLPDAPTWQFLTPGWRSTFTVTGFQIFRLPCEVTGVRAMLHMRNNGLGTPPNATETIAEDILSTRMQIER